MEHSTLVGYSILVIERSAPVARGLRVLLEGAGAEVFTVASSQSALPFVGEGALSAAVLDFGQSAEENHSVAKLLSGLGISFVFCKDAGTDKAWPSAPVLNKPVVGAQLIALLYRLLADEPKGEPDYAGRVALFGRHREF
jgi:CheY-like chemotaxis protein